MDKILNHILSPKDKIIKYGNIVEEVLMELKMITSLYNYIQVVTKYYDDEERPYVNTWVDIEGMGYGWAWMAYEEKDWHKMMSKMVACEADRMLKDMENTLYFVYEDEKVKTYHFITLDGLYRTDVIISFSNTEIYR
ncbi:hypothetical protein [Bacillus sp. T33-2]|uniref:hypothetical protein n=1 Tax=Bacillus sp. T33-2 TaxID=2054168 RepID=UPI000C75F511|nr:hypothetical protein [Bacillus sp. T33-2]PLR99604.1 hypothetical protein CVD19_00645 [Bacillus sp. T33-2]